MRLQISLSVFCFALRSLQALRTPSTKSSGMIFFWRMFSARSTEIVPATIEKSASTPMNAIPVMPLSTTIAKIESSFAGAAGCSLFSLVSASGWSTPSFSPWPWTVELTINNAHETKIARRIR